MKNKAIETAKILGCILAGLYAIFAFSSCAYNWTMHGFNPGFWDQEVRGVFVGLFVIAVFIALLANAPDKSGTGVTGHEQE